MNGNVELLNFIYQNAEMGKDTTSQLIDIVEEESFVDLLKRQYGQYHSFFKAAQEKINELQKPAKGKDSISKGMAYLMINVKTMRDKSSSHIAEMLIQGSTMGTVDLIKKMREYNDADNEILELADRLLKFEEKNIEELKSFL